MHRSHTRQDEQHSQELRIQGYEIDRITKHVLSLGRRVDDGRRVDNDEPLLLESTKAVGP